MQISHILLSSASLSAAASLSNQPNLNSNTTKLQHIESAYIPRFSMQAYTKEENWDLRQFPGANILKAQDETKGKHTYVGIIDSGFYPDHDDIDYSNIVIDPNLEQDGCKASSELGIQAHGHRILGVVQKAAPETRIVPLNLRDCSVNSTQLKRATRTVDDFAKIYVKSIQQVTAAARRDHEKNNTALPFSLVINISNLIRFSQCPSLLQKQIDKSVTEDNVHFVVAIGNHANNGSVGFPVNCKNVVRVGASTTIGKAASFSNYGSEVDIYAPGKDILTTEYNNTLTEESGTSYSAPIVAAAFALIQSALIQNQMPLLNQSQLKDSIVQTTHWLNTCERDKDECNKGVINTFNALEYAKNQSLMSVTSDTENSNIGNGNVVTSKAPATRLHIPSLALFLATSLFIRL